ncbi:MAG: hypothetical protein DHS20C01_10190 [marine bacterium B5-7]|nr:MAG: hypothetical protein DHS20C01_10190 [marine bacterium B5-7]
MKHITCKARPAYKRAFDAQLVVFTGKPWSGRSAPEDEDVINNRKHRWKRNWYDEGA